MVSTKKKEKKKKIFYIYIFFLLFLIGISDMVLGKKCGYFRLGMGPKFGPKRWAENLLLTVRYSGFGNSTIFYLSRDK